MDLNDALADWDGVNGRNGSNGEVSLSDLESMFADLGLEFRHFPDAGCGALHWQAGRCVADFVTLEDGSGYMVERFELLAWASTREGLIDKPA